ncbi:MAG: type II toxin-antitoxin system HicB family antitoxin [Candidatus Sulfotelmatobacter sp.]
MNFKIEFDREEDGRWIAEIPELPGVMAYGATKDEAEAAVEALALRVIADCVGVEKARF